MLKVGDKVRIVSSDHDPSKNSEYVGYEGVVCHLTRTEIIGITFDISKFPEKVTGFFHNCNHRCPNGTGQYYHISELQLIPEISILDRLQLLYSKMSDADEKGSSLVYLIIRRFEDGVQNKLSKEQADYLNLLAKKYLVV